MHDATETAETTQEVQAVTIRAKTVIRAAAHLYGFEPRQITGPRRGKDLCRVRHIAMHVVCETKRHSLPQVGRFFGNRDHTTVLHGHRKVRAMAAMSAEIAAEVEMVRTLATELETGAASIPKLVVLADPDFDPDEYQDTTSIAATEKPTEADPLPVATSPPKKDRNPPERRLRPVLSPAEKLARMKLSETEVGSRMWCEIQNARFFLSFGYPYVPTIEVRA